MKQSTEAIAAAPGAAGGTGEPSVPALVLIFWAAFAAAAVFMQVTNPETFARTDPDSVLRLVQVRDVLAGQDWFDLVQHRMAPPDGVLMHWSRLIDAPLAGLILLGNALNLNGETLALTLWPILLLLVSMAGSVSAATALGGRGAVTPALLMTLTFYHPLGYFLPGSIDHHNAQIAFALLTLAFALRLRQTPLLGLAAGLGAALTLAIGLETLVYVALFGIVIAASWALTGKGGRGTAYFGSAFAVAPAALYLLIGSPAAATACDSLSWTYAAPAAVAGTGLVALALVERRLGGPAIRMLALAVLAALTAGAFLLIAAECRSGPYGLLSAEFNAVILQTVSEAQPLLATLPSRPADAVASIVAPLLALAVALRRIWASPTESRYLWALPAALIAAAAGLTFYQVRAAPYANAFALPILAAWVSGLAARYGVHSLRPVRRSWPVVGALLLAMPLAHLGLGLAAVRTLDLATAGRGAPARQQTSGDEIEELRFSRRECVDPAAAAHFARAPQGLVLAPLFYGSSVLALSSHSVLAGPYHRAEAAALDTVRALSAAPVAALRIVHARGVDAIAVCPTSEEVTATIREAPDGLLARLVAGGSVDWLEPLAPSPGTALQLYRVRGTGVRNTQRADTM